jgi:hypothetical protein
MKTIKTKYGIIAKSDEHGKIDFNKSMFNSPCDRNLIDFLRDEQAIKKATE